jgi:pimeloyl-ACP methyl ester carboxylesterase
LATRAARLPEPPIPVYGRGAIGVLDFDPLAWWARVHVPVLALWGEDDELVPAIRSRDSIRTALGRRESRLLTARTFSGTGHGLAVVRREGAPWDWPRLAPQFHDALVDWVVAHTLERSDEAGRR